MPIIFLPLQYKNNIINNQNIYIMVNYKLFANVNLLKPNYMICVMDSSSIGTVSSSVARSLICKKANELACKGYNVKVHEISDSIVDFTKFV